MDILIFLILGFSNSFKIGFNAFYGQRWRGVKVNVLDDDVNFSPEAKLISYNSKQERGISVNNKFKLSNILLCSMCIINLMGCNLTVNIHKTDSNKYDDNTENIEKSEDDGIEYKHGTILPLGTVISLKNSNEKLIISGWIQFLEEDKVYDYSGVEYPKGFVSDEDGKLFNEEDIDKVYFYGYEDNEGIEYRNKVIKYRNNLRNKSDEFLQENKTESNDSTEYTIDKDEMLTLGSVVSIKGKEQRYMIFSRLMRNEDNKLFDYYGCLYPEGNTTPDDNILFNSDEISNVYFNGYKDEKEIERNKLLIRYKNIIEKEE